MSQSTTDVVPEELVGAYERYGEIIRAESPLFYRCILLVLLVGAPVSIIISIWVLPAIWPNGANSLFYFFQFGAPFLFAVPLDLKRRKLERERFEISNLFRRRGLHICHDPGLRVDVLKIVPGQII